MNNPIFERIFSAVVGEAPTVSFAASSFAEARQLPKEDWFQSDLLSLRSNGCPIWDGKAKILVRLATEDEVARFNEATKSTVIHDELVLAYLIELDG